MKRLRSLSLFAVAAIASLALASCGLGLFSSGADDGPEQGSEAVREEYNEANGRWEAFDASNNLIWYEIRQPKVDPTSVERYSASGEPISKWVASSSQLEGGGTRLETCDYLPGGDGGWELSSRLLSDSGLPLPAGTAGGGVTRNATWRYGGRDLLQEYSATDLDAAGRVVATYRFSGTSQLLGASLYRDGARSSSLTYTYDAASSLIGLQRVLYDAEGRWAAVLRYDGELKYVESPTAVELWAWPDAGAQAGKGAAPAASDGWSSHIAISASTAGESQVLAVSSAELRGFDSAAHLISTKLYEGARLAEERLTTYDGGQKTRYSLRRAPAGAATVGASISFDLPAEAEAGARAVDAAAPSALDIELPELEIPDPPDLPGGGVSLSDVETEEKSYTLWYYDARGSLEASFRSPAFPTATVFTPVADATNAYGLKELGGQPLSLVMEYSPDGLRPTRQALSWNGKERYALSQSYDDETGLLNRFDAQGELVLGGTASPIHLYVEADYRTDYTPEELRLFLAGAEGAADTHLFTLKPVYANDPLQLDIPAWEPGMDPIWFGTKLWGEASGIEVTGLELYEGPSLGGTLKGRYVLDYDYDGSGSTAIDVASVQDGVEVTTARLLFEHNAEGRTVSLKAYTVTGGVPAEEPDWRYDYEYEEVVAAASELGSELEPAVSQVVAKRKYDAEGALDIYEALESTELFQSLLVNLGF